MDPGWRPWRLIEKRKRTCEIVIWIDGNQAGGGAIAQRLSHEDRARAGLLHLRSVFRVGEKGQLRRTGMLDPRDSGNLNATIPGQLAAESRSQITEPIGLAQISL